MRPLLYTVSSNLYDLFYVYIFSLLELNSLTPPVPAPPPPRPRPQFPILNVYMNIIIVCRQTRELILSCGSIAIHQTNRENTNGVINLFSFLEHRPIKGWSLFKNPSLPAFLQLHGVSGNKTMFLC